MNQVRLSGIRNPFLTCHDIDGWRGRPPEVERYAGHDDVRLEEERALDEQRVLLVKEMLFG